MEPLCIIKDSDIFEDSVVEPKFYRLRLTAWGIILNNEDNVALLSLNERYTFPGINIRKDDDVEAVVVEEFSKVIGKKIRLVRYLGYGEEYRAHTARKYESHFFVLRIVEEEQDDLKKKLVVMEKKRKASYEIHFESLAATQKILRKQIESLDADDYAMQFITRTQRAVYTVLMKLRKGEQEEGKE